MDELVVNDKLPSTIIDDQRSDTSSPLIISALDPVKEIVVVDDGETLLDIPRLRYAHHAGILTNVQDAVLQEHRSQHALHIH
jgi:hypothetical protein